MKSSSVYGIERVRVARLRLANSRHREREAEQDNRAMFGTYRARRRSTYIITTRWITSGEELK